MIKPEVKLKARMLGHSGAIYSIIPSAEPDIIYSGSSDRIVTAWSLKTFEAQKFAIRLQAIPYALCFVKEKNLLLIGVSDGGIHIIDLESKQEIKLLRQHTEAVFDIKYSIKTNCFYAAGGDGIMSVTSLESLSHVRSIPLCKEKLRAIEINELTNQILIGCGDGIIRLLELESNELKTQFSGHQFSIYALQFHPDNIHFLSGARDAHLNVWDTNQNKAPLNSIPAHNFAIYSIMFSADGKLIATGSRDKTIKLWDAENFDFLLRINKEQYDAHNFSVNKVLWAEYNNYLISTGDDKSICVWEVDY